MPQTTDVTIGGVTFNPVDFAGIAGRNALALTGAKMVLNVIPVVGPILSGIVDALGIRGKTQHIPSPEAYRLGVAFADTYLAELDRLGFPYEAKVNGKYPFQYLAEFGIQWSNVPDAALPPYRYLRVETLSEFQRLSVATDTAYRNNFGSALANLAIAIYRNEDGTAIEARTPAQLKYATTVALAPVWQAIRDNNSISLNGLGSTIAKAGLTTILGWLFIGGLVVALFIPSVRKKVL